MKNNLKLLGIIALVALIGFSMTACEGPMGPQGGAGADGSTGHPGQNSYIVIFNSNGGIPLIEAAGVSNGACVAEPADPVKAGFVFDGWYTDNLTFNNLWDFETAVTANIILNAKWFEFPMELQGTWLGDEEVWGTEKFIITDTMFTSAFISPEGEESVTYSGKIVNIRDAGSAAGYITIRYAAATYYPDSVGNYYVIHYENLSASEMSIAGAGNWGYGGGEGEPTRVAAEARFTVANEYFDYHTDVTLKP